MADSARARALEAALKQSPAAHKVAVYLGEELVRQVPLPTGRKRVARAIDVVEKLTWSRCEVLDKQGGVLAVADNDAPAGDPEDLTGKEAAREERVLRLMLQAQREVLTYRLKESEALASTMTACMNMMTSAIRTLATVYKEQVDVAAEVGAASAATAQKTEKTEEEELDSVMKQLVVGKLLEHVTGAGGAGGGGNGVGH